MNMYRPVVPAVTALTPTRIPERAKPDLTVLYIAKHALGDGSMDAADGNHSPYHFEIRQILEEIGVRLRVGNSYEALFEKPHGVDFVFPLLNRGGFLNSEMLLPLLATRHAIPFLGASPILRGVSDDKHLTKLEARSRGIPTLDWAIYRRGAPVREADCPRADRWVIKPNASSASWGIADASDWAGVAREVDRIHDEGHDAIVEPFLIGNDVEVPMIGRDGAPFILPPMIFRQSDRSHLRTHGEKRELVDQSQGYILDFLDDRLVWPKIKAMAMKMAAIFHPFDYGRYEFRWCEETGEVQLLEVNLNCNLWSQKVYGRVAQRLGWSHRDMVETILAESLDRHGLIRAERGESTETLRAA